MRFLEAFESTTDVLNCRGLRSSSTGVFAARHGHFRPDDIKRSGQLVSSICAGTFGDCANLGSALRDGFIVERWPITAA